MEAHSVQWMLDVVASGQHTQKFSTMNTLAHLAVGITQHQQSFVRGRFRNLSDYALRFIRLFYMYQNLKV